VKEKERRVLYKMRGAPGEKVEVAHPLKKVKN
jgi:hypothetical protein